jgi:CRP/FNR family transcriptional regulator, cyclic AMP receptor protein
MKKLSQMLGLSDERRQEKLNYLTTIEIFRDLSRPEIEAIDRQLSMSTSAPGNVFYMPDETGEVLFLLKKGTVQLYRLTPEGKKIVVAMLGPGSLFGEMSLIGQGMHSTFAEAVDECKLCVMSRSDVERLMREKPQVALRIVEALGSRLVQMERQIEDVAFKSIPARLASLLLRLADEQSSDTIKGYTHQDLADMVGTYRETVTLTLNELKADGLLEIGRKRVLLKDRAALEQIAES